MATRVVEWKKPYTWWKAISIDENKVISLNLRNENNLIIYDEWDDEIYVDLQLPDWIEPTDAFPVWVTTGRAVVADWWDKAGTIISAKTTSWDEIKILYADEWTLWIDNWTGTFKQIYFKADVDAIVQAIWDYIYANCNTKTFYTGTYDVSLAQAVYDWISQGNFWIVYFNPVSWIKRDVIFPPTTTTTGTISSWSYTDVRQAIWWMFYEDLITLEFWVSDWVATTGINYHWTVINNDWRIIIADTVAPSAIDWTTWYDTTTHTMKVWDWTAWQLVWWTDIEYVTQAEYNALLPWALTDNKHYFIYSTSGWGWWQPWVNTVAYYPLTADTNDYSWNNRNLTNSWVTFVNNIWWATVPVSYYDWSSRAYRNWVEQLNTWYTISFWQKGDTWTFIFDLRNDNEYWQWVCLLAEWWYFKTRQQKSSNTEEEYSRASDNNRNHWVLTWTGSVWTVYFNWAQVKQASIANSINTSNSDISLWSRYSGNTYSWTGYISEFIVENTARTAQEISDYYNQTKWNYWIS